MSGIYIHIPFCKQACHYCDFHFSTNMRLKDDMLKAIIKEIELQKSFFDKGTQVFSIYFGGGTPSILSADEIKSILNHIHSYFKVASSVEITLEANPDDISSEKLQELYKAGINRLSLGIQTFNPRLLKWMNRSHNQEEAYNALEVIAQSPIENYSLDLIYGNPDQSLIELASDIDKLLKFNPPHISAYCLTIEEKTVFGKMAKRGVLREIDEEAASSHFIKVNTLLNKAGYEHYEISNYALPGMASKHNTNYWKGIPYLGIGPGAHSYNIKTRQYNVANNSKYIKSLGLNEIPSQIEFLNRNDRINEYIMTSLRTSEGVSLQKLLLEYEYDLQREYASVLDKWVTQDLAEITNNSYIKLSLKGKLLADKLASDLFLVA